MGIRQLLRAVPPLPGHRDDRFHTNDPRDARQRNGDETRMLTARTLLIPPCAAWRTLLSLSKVFDQRSTGRLWECHHGLAERDSTAGD